jgi:hypothetical protein
MYIPRGRPCSTTHTRFDHWREVEEEEEEEEDDDERVQIWGVLVPW